jgi:hypothetical protein
MGRLTPLLPTLLLAAALTLALSSCGGGSDAKLLPGTTARQIEANLDTVQALANEGECVGAIDAASEVSAEVDELGGVDPELKKLLREGAERLNSVVLTCDEPAEEDEEASTEEFEAEEPDISGAEEAREEKENEKGEKPEKQKPEKEPVEPTEPSGQEKKEPPAEEAEQTPPSGGVGPGAEAGEG